MEYIDFELNTDLVCNKW